MGRKRTTTSKQLPARWAVRSGAYYYRPREAERMAFDGQSWFRLGTTYPEALKVYAQRLELACGESLASVAKRYVAEVVSGFRPNTQAGYMRSADRLSRIMGRSKVAAINPQGVYQYLDHISQRHSKNVANADLKVLNAILDSAVRWGMVERNRIKGAVKYYGVRDGVRRSRDRYVEDWELAEWRKVATPVQRAFAALVMLTGARKGEVLRMQRSDIKDGQLRIRSSKTSKDTYFVLTPALRQAVDFALSVQARPSVFLLPNRAGQCFVNSRDTSPTFDKSWRRSMVRAIERTDLEEPFTRHDLRAKVGSDADSDERAQQLLGHTSVGMTKRHYRRKVQAILPAE